MKEEINYNTKHSAIILSAGISERFGEPKFLLPLPNGKIFLENIIDSFRDFGCEKIVVVINQLGIERIRESKPSLFEKAYFIVNNSLQLGRFFSIKLGTNQLENPNSVFIHNVDNPFVSTKTLITLSQKLKNYDFVFPCYKGKGGHPILVNRKIIESILKEEASDINFKILLNNFRGNIVDVDDRKITLNINTTAEYELMLNEFFSSN